MAKPSSSPPKDNHGQAVSAYVHELIDARVEGEHPGIGQLVSEFAKQKDGGVIIGGGGVVASRGGPITVTKVDGSTQSFTTFADALNYSTDGDTIHVAKGVYTETFSLDEKVTIIGEAGAVIDASAVNVSAGTQGAIQLFDGFSGGSISGLTIKAVHGGNALVSIAGQAVTDVHLTGNTFDAGANTTGSVVYLNEGTSVVVVDGNTFTGAALSASPLLGLEADGVQVSNNTFGLTTGAYAKVEIFPGANGDSDDVVLTGNVGLGTGDVMLG